MNLNINDTVSWSSAAGNLTGYISNIYLNLNAANQVVPWIDITCFNDKGRVYTVRTVRLCGTEQNLKAMHVTKVFDTETV
jgi:hypothetical protein